MSSALLLHALSASASDANLLHHRAVFSSSSSSASVHSTPLPGPTRPTTTTTTTTPHTTKASSSRISSPKAGGHSIPSIGTSKTNSSGLSSPKTSSKPLIPTSITATGPGGITPGSSGIPIIVGSTVPPATEPIAASTVTLTPVTLAPPAASTSTAQTVVVTNPDDPSQSATFVKQDVPADLQSQLPSIPTDTLLPLIITIRGVATPVLVSSAGTMVVPLGTVPAWLTPDLFPSPERIPETDNSPENESTTSSSTTPTSSAMASITLTITTDLTALTADTIDGLTSFPPGTGQIPDPTTPPIAPPSSTPLTIPPTSSSTPSPAAPPTPTETAGNNKGSALCPSLEGACTIAYRGYVDDFLYMGYTSYVASTGDGDPINWLFAPFANNGCAAMFSCREYSVGMTGAQIKQAVENMFVGDGVEECGSTYLSNGCQVTLNGCNDCQPAIPCGALPSGVTWDGCY